MVPEQSVSESPRPAGGSLPPAEEIVRRYEADSIAQHPLFQKLGREDVDMSRLWVMLSNGREGIIKDFSRWLAGVTARTTDERLRSMLAKQLNDELGNGDFTKTHRVLFDQLLAGLEPWRPATVTPEMMAPGREFNRRLEAVYSDPREYVGIGAAMAIEVLGKQIDSRIADELRREQKLTPTAMTWLTLHEELEIDHANESMDMAHLVPPAQLEAAWRGAEGVATAFWDFFDAMYGAKTPVVPAPILTARA